MRYLPALTIFILLLNGFGVWYSDGAVVLLAALGLAQQRWLRNPRYWFLMTGVYAAGVFANWSTCDNHQYLIAYWCVALSATLSVEPRQRNLVLRTNSRYLIAPLHGAGGLLAERIEQLP